jgi:hypothetical protein
VIKISAVPPEMVADYWDVAFQLFSKSFEYSALKISPEDVYEDVMRGNQSLWLVFEDEPFLVIGAFTIRVKSYPAGHALAGEHLGGERLSEWADQLFQIMEQYARDLNISHLELIGRRGWEKILKPKGWKANLVIFEKEI